jgi:hypothetical protein
VNAPRARALSIQEIQEEPPDRGGRRLARPRDLADDSIMAQAWLIADQDAGSPQRLADEIRALVAAGDVARAREILATLDDQLRAHPAVAKWARALRPPEVRVGGHESSRSVDESAPWLRAHAAEHFGQWVALRGGALVGAHAELAELQRDLERRGEHQDVLFFRLTNG